VEGEPKSIINSQSLVLLETRLIIHNH